MLSEIFCEEFHQKTIVFNEGFNVVLGTNTGDNSIGKSSFLLIVDFVFGGDTYSKSVDILDNIGSHIIGFKFIFGGQPFYFSRKIDESNVVHKCDENYNVISSMSNEAYCKWLAQMYNITMYGSTFRDTVGRYIRVYGKENYDEKRPLHYVPQEAGSKAIIAILKLFNFYSAIERFEKKLEGSIKAQSVFEKAQKLDYIAKIGKRTFNTNQKEISRIESEIQELSDQISSNLLDVDSEASEQAIQIKKALSKAKRLRSYTRNRLATLADCQEYKFSSTTEDFEELARYFPNANLRHIREIEAFHQKISAIFNEEILNEKSNVDTQLSDYDSIVTDLENQLKSLVNNPNLSQLVLQKHADLLNEKKKLQQENQSYLKLEKLKQTKAADQENLKSAKDTQLGMIEKKLNFEMDRINDLLYSQRYNAPYIHFTDSNYVFKTPDDTGTGVAYKGLVVFDLSIMHLTQMPILVHDSVVLKHIADDAIEGIVNQYIACGKQTIIALDKQESYTPKTATLLEKYSILKLAPNGEELFGRSWGKKPKTNL